MTVEATAEYTLAGPCPRAGVTITGLGIGDSIVTVWRNADEERTPVQGLRRVVMNDAAFVTDWAVPLGRPVRYEVEVLSGPGGFARATANTITVDSPTGFIQDALLPQSAVPVLGEPRTNGDVYLRSPALSQLEYNADISIFKIMGSDKPMALFGQRMAEMGLDTSLGTRSAEENARLKKLLKSTAQLLFRPLPSWGDIGLSGAMYLGNAKATQVPVNVLMGGQLTWWDLQSDVVSAPAIKVLTATWTYGDVQMLMSTYGQKQALMAGKTYLDDLKSPVG